MKKGENDFFNLSLDEDIYSVVGKMESAVAFYDSSKRFFGMASFLKTYLMVTQEVMKNSLKKSYFKDVEALRKLDVYFASLYFKPAKDFVFGNKKRIPWRVHFDYCSRKKSLPFVQTLTGINSHINGDLPVTLLKMNYKERKDFLKINQILLGVIPKLMKYLAFERHDFYAAGALIFRKFVVYEFKKVVVRWREDAWKNYLKLKKMNRIKRNYEIWKMRRETEKINKEIIQIFDDVLKFKNPLGLVRRMNRLSYGIR